MLRIIAGTHTETIFNMVRGDIPQNFGIIGADKKQKKEYVKDL